MPPLLSTKIETKETEGIREENDIIRGKAIRTRPCGETVYHNSLLKSYSGLESRQGYFVDVSGRDGVTGSRNGLKIRWE